MITLHRIDPDGLPVEDRIAFPVEDIRQIHEGKGGVTIITTPVGKLPVQESFDDVMGLVEKERKDASNS